MVITNSLWTVMVAVFVAVGCASTKQTAAGGRQPTAPEIPATTADGSDQGLPPQSKKGDTWQSREIDTGDSHSDHDHDDHSHGQDTGAISSGSSTPNVTGNVPVPSNPRSPLGNVAGANTNGSIPAGATNTPASSDPNVVVFRIKPGTGRGPWNDASNPIRGRVGQTLEVHNDDSIQHWIHTNFAPFFHPFSGIAPGQSARYQLVSPSNGGSYDHLTGGAIHMIVTQ